MQPDAVRMLDFDALNSFIVFAEELNFTRAAARLHISQPALHVKIRKLAEGLGVPLYQRSGRNLYLTREGKEVARFGREMREHANGFVEELQTGQSRQPVVLAAGEGAYLYLLGPAIKQFLHKAPANVQLLTRDRDATLEAVRSGAAHLGVAVLDVIPDDVQAHRLVSVPEVLVVPHRHRFAGRKTLRLQDLAGAPLIVPPPDRPHRGAITRALRAAGVEWNVALEATGWELMIRFVELGLGLAIVNGCCRIPRGLVAIPIKGLPATDYYLIHRQHSIQKGNPALLKRVLLSQKY